MSTLSDFEPLVGALVALVIGGVGIWIAFWQMWISKEKLRTDLFDRRFAIFSAYQIMVDSVKAIGGHDAQQVMPLLKNAADQAPFAYFLLDDALFNFLSELSDAAHRAVVQEERSVKFTGKANANVQSKQDDKADVALARFEEMAEQLRPRFERYLRLKDFQSGRQHNR